MGDAVIAVVGRPNNDDDDEEDGPGDDVVSNATSTTWI